MTRSEMIEVILAKSRKPCPEIVVSFMMENIHDGKRHSLFGMPFNHRPEDYRRVDLGFVFRSRDGTTYGLRQPTKEILREKFEAAQDSNAADFRAQLDAMSDQQVQAQFDYWKTINQKAA